MKGKKLQRTAVVLLILLLLLTGGRMNWMKPAADTNAGAVSRGAVGCTAANEGGWDARQIAEEEMTVRGSDEPAAISGGAVTADGTATAIRTSGAHGKPTDPADEVIVSLPGISGGETVAEPGDAEDTIEIEEEALPGGAAPDEELPPSQGEAETGGGHGGHDHGNSDGTESGEAGGSDNEDAETGEPEPGEGENENQNPGSGEEEPEDSEYGSNLEETLAAAQRIIDGYDKLTTDQERQAYFGIKNNNFSNDAFRSLLLKELGKDALLPVDADVMANTAYCADRELYLQVYFIQNGMGSRFPVAFATSDSLLKANWNAYLVNVDGSWYESNKMHPYSGKQEPVSVSEWKDYISREEVIEFLSGEQADGESLWLLCGAALEETVEPLEELPFLLPEVEIPAILEDADTTSPGAITGDAEESEIESSEPSLEEECVGSEEGTELVEAEEPVLPESEEAITKEEPSEEQAESGEAAADVPEVVEASGQDDVADGAENQIEE